MDMKKLMCPSSMVIIGASEKPGMTGGATKTALLGSIRDRVYYLNPRHDMINGRKCYHALKELPEKVDCMVICTPARFVAAYLEEGGAMGIPAAVVFASGFSEERSEQAQALAQEVEDICKKYDMALCGPNCVGIFNGVDQISVSAGDPLMIPMLNGQKHRGIGLVAQSGYITSGFANPDVDWLAYVVSAGNCTMCSIEDYMYYFAEDNNVTCLAAYIEGVKKPDRLVEALTLAARKRKPVVVLKAGMTEKGSFAAASHTGSLAGNYRIYESVFRKFGVILVQSVQEFVSTARMFAVLDGNLPKRPGIGAVNFSGGENTLCADTCSRYDLELPEYSQKTRDCVQSLVPSYSTAVNPLDATTTMFSETDKVRRLFAAISQDENIGLITLGNDVGVQSEPKDITCVDIMSQMAAEHTLLPAVVIPSFEKERNTQIRARFEQAGIPVLSTGNLAYQAIRHLMDFTFFDREGATFELALHQNICCKKETHALSEGESKKQLAPYGIRIPKQRLVREASEVEACLEDLSFPVVMKVESQDILHKTEAGGVKLGIGSVKEACQCFNEIMKNCREYAPEADISGVMIQEMAADGVEVIIGVQNDPMFGPVILTGLGGVFVEIFKDTVLYPCPVSHKEAVRMLSSLKGYKLLEGYRGSRPADIDALAQLIVQISGYASEHRDTLEEMDLNPVRVYENGGGTMVVDALIVEKIME